VPRSLFLLALLPLAFGQTSGAPSYSPAGLVNAATNQPGPLAPNTLAILNGADLAWITAATRANPGDQLPQRMAGVQVFLTGGAPAFLTYVSPTQIKFLVPASRVPGDTTLNIVRNGLFGPSIPLTLAETAPAIFQTDNLATATHADGSPINRDSLPTPGESIVLFCTGLGPPVIPRDSADDGRLLPLDVDLSTVRLANFDDLALTLNDTPIDPQLIQWAGLTPGAAGMYQINLQLPATLDPDPQIRISIGGQASPEGVRLPTQPSPAVPRQ
jgi:uncharacterized protein (TIGR03437 family)